MIMFCIQIIPVDTCWSRRMSFLQMAHLLEYSISKHDRHKFPFSISMNLHSSRSVWHKTQVKRFEEDEVVCDIS